MSDKLDLNQVLNFQRKKWTYHQEISFLVLNTTREVDIFVQMPLTRLRKPFCRDL